MEKKMINICEWIRGGSIIREVSVEDIQKELLKAAKDGEIEILNSSLKAEDIFSEELICAAINSNEKILEKAGLLNLEIYYKFYYGDFEEEYYPAFIHYFIENNAYEFSKINYNSLDIDDWEIVDIEVE